MDMQGLRLVRKIVYARVEVEKMREPKYSKLQRKVVYPRIDAGRKCCLQGFKAVKRIADARAHRFSKQGECKLGMQIQNYTP